MPHVSEKKLNTKVSKKLHSLVRSFIKNTGSNQRLIVFNELLTSTEKLMFGKRILIIYMITRGVPTLTICSLLKISPSTVARFHDRVSRGKYKTTISWLKYEATENQILRLMRDLLAIPFEDKGRPMRLGTYIDDKL